ncbi:hypothetical protein V6N12_026249 [Hibiscus sabdariffa]|uniref:eIF3a PCI domain-containing protein n=1 Tax=Hibiscus sabdariffa TaxID=183260 RepID=A0ABR2DUE3_9ROSI
MRNGVYAELINVGQKQDALLLLHNDGLIQYRIVCQQVNVSSLEEVIKHFMHLSTEKAEQARSQAQTLQEALDVDDLEADKRPGDLMLSYVSGEKGKDRSDSELVTPWFKFLWETYRTVLEILRNNSKLEASYVVFQLSINAEQLKIATELGLWQVCCCLVYLLRKYWTFGASLTFSSICFMDSGHHPHCRTE